MAAELSQHQLEELVNGKAQTPNIVFFDKARLNVAESKKVNRRMYDTITYIKETQAGVTDWIPQKARKHHIKQYPEEYQYYLESKQGVASPSINIIPNITPAEIQELTDYGLTNIEVLSAADQVPPHLEHIYRNAKVLQSVFTEQKNVSNEEDHIEEARDYEKESPAKALSEANRCHDTHHVERPTVPASASEPERETSKRVSSGGRINDNPYRVSTDWSFSVGFQQ